ncbi:MAG: hypothetical protein IPK56_11330 [Elusimicrobia bacterium]|nr:hypothetical protein [Elusimicrobiota bacterium]
MQGVYPPGSVFKIITALTGLNDARWDTHRTFYCNGVYLLPITGGVREFKCWNKHHRQDFWGAVAWSCNIYFYNIGLTAGPEALASRAKAFGFGEKTGIDLPSESSGLMPDREWKKRARREGWFDGDTLNTAIGQGFVLSTPLQAAVFVAAVANGGTVWKPYLVREARATTGQTLWRGKSEIRRTVELNNATWGTLHRAMGNVVSQGSGRVIYRPDLDLGAKTGPPKTPTAKTTLGSPPTRGPKGNPRKSPCWSLSKTAVTVPRRRAPSPSGSSTPLFPRGGFDPWSRSFPGSSASTSAPARRASSPGSIGACSRRF